MEITGRLTHFGDRVEGQSQRGPWRKQLFVIETLEQYPCKVALLAWNDQCDTLDVLNLGDTITAQISIESREFNDKWYTDVKAYNIKGASQQSPQVAQVPNPPLAPLTPMPGAQQQNMNFNTEGSDDLPF